MAWYIKVLKQYATFSGRARRREFWLFFLVSFILSAILETLGIELLYSLAVFIPSIAVGVRRLHDTNRSGKWLFIFFVPFIGWIWLLIYLIEDGGFEENRYGRSPKMPPETV